MVHIIKSFPIPSDTLLGRYREQAVATVHEASGQRGALDVSIKPIARGMRICGRAVTVSCPPGDNLMLIKAISLSGPGDVIVLNSGRVANAGPFGEVLAIECLTKGINGFLTSGSVRDSQAIIALGFSVFAAGVSVRGTAKASLGTINHAICCGDVVINPGDIILGDDDGAVAIPLSEAERVLEVCRQREDKEKRIMERIRAGGSLWDIYGYQAVLDRLGCQEEGVLQEKDADN